MLRIFLLLFASAVLVRGGEVTLKIENVSAEGGNIAALFFATADGFPNETAHAAFKTQVKAQAGITKITLSDLPDGRYAVCVIHDTNGNAKLDRNFIGIPTEGVGISNGIRREKPTFDKAVVEITGGGTVVIPLKYW